MALENQGKAPYAPPEPLITLIEKYRNMGLAAPFDADVLIRAGVSESLVPRVLAGMKLLDLIDESGNPTSELVALRQAPTPEYKQRVAEWVRGAYAPIFQFVDPTTADATAIGDAFRVYEPAGQRDRMVTLFAGLCEYAGIVDEAPTKKRVPGKDRKPSAVRPPTRKRSTPPPPPPDASPTNGTFSQGLDLSSGGRIVLTVTGNPLSFNAAERDLVFGMTDLMNAYRERRALTAGAASNDEGNG